MAIQNETRTGFGGGECAAYVGHCRLRSDDLRRDGVRAEVGCQDVCGETGISWWVGGGCADE